MKPPQTRTPVVPTQPPVGVRVAPLAVVTPEWEAQKLAQMALELGHDLGSFSEEGWCLLASLTYVNVPTLAIRRLACQYLARHLEVQHEFGVRR